MRPETLEETISRLQNGFAPADVQSAATQLKLLLTGVKVKWPVSATRALMAFLRQYTSEEIRKFALMEDQLIPALMRCLDRVAAEMKGE